MTTRMTDLEIIEQIPFMDEQDDEEHVACWRCYPYDEYPPGTIIVAVCGDQSEETSVEDAPGMWAITCERCKVIKFCPECGANLWYY